MSNTVTTATTSSFEFVLSKYSKASSESSALENAEWQHFTNPVIRLFLDLRKSSNYQLESARVRILWTMNSGLSMSQNSPDVIFEDIDLLSFSSLPLHDKNMTAQGLPLKAVYRDAMVGIRYLDLGARKDTEISAIYRRFQITFDSAASASQFIDSIQTVCPCKTNPQPVPLPRPPQMIKPISSGMFAPPVTPSRQASFFTSPQRMPSSQSPNVMHTPQRKQTMVTPSATTPFPTATPSPLCRITSFASPMAEEANDQISENNAFSQFPVPSTSIAQANQPMSDNTEPPSSQPPSDPSSLMIASLQEATSLYDIPKETLEKIIGDVVREDGFTKLLENVSTLWNVKTYLNY